MGNEEQRDVGVRSLRLVGRSKAERRDREAEVVNSFVGPTWDLLRNIYEPNHLLFTTCSCSVLLIFSTPYTSLNLRHREPLLTLHVDLGIQRVFLLLVWLVSFCVTIHLLLHLNIHEYIILVLCCRSKVFVDATLDLQQKQSWDQLRCLYRGPSRVGMKKHPVYITWCITDILKM